jgi:hypothetical protein
MITCSVYSPHAQIPVSGDISPYIGEWVYFMLRICTVMVKGGGGEVLGRLGGKDLNKDGRVVNLAIVGSSRFYDFSVVEEAIDDWAELEAHPDLVIVGGASGVDYLAERWADNNNVPIDTAGTHKEQMFIHSVAAIFGSGHPKGRYYCEA